MDLARREHVRFMGTTVSQAVRRTLVHRERCEFTGGRDDPGEGGGSRIFAGPAGALSPPEPRWPVDQAEIEERLRTFIDWAGGDITLHHRAMSAGRVVVSGSSPARRWHRTVFSLTGHAVAGGGRELPLGFSGRGAGLEVLSSQSAATAIARARSALAAAEGPVPGNPAVVLSPQPAAVLVHEAVGHYAEAVHVGDPAVHRLFTRVASEVLSVHDQQDRPDEPVRPAQQCDDEGVLSLGPTHVVDHGVLVAQLHSRSTARAAACASTGNARAAQVWDTPIPRMWSIACAPGSSREEALVEELHSGIYIHRLAHGYRQGTVVAADVVLAEHVSRGRRTGRYFTGGQVLDRADILTRVAEVANRVERNANGMCGKDGQLLFDVMTSAPAMRLSSLRLTA
jgi:predicted Zn-dependent protease